MKDMKIVQREICKFIAVYFCIPYKGFSPLHPKIIFYILWNIMLTPYILISRRYVKEIRAFAFK